ncbi:uncharacterized protein RHOBADRAFT_65606 [Rhodotorula graminis WP1]|uniref:Elongation factor 1-gamma n=1 Tax=Rhodotorula graminis (strain WP1) TaxID=578459 RepID=A0A0P9ESS9_RHOGW|nr:uncharacterized protein RHOBADRAFT_65606 [Rhodotorula graminis WP1]KPV72338.1 hypothetical protein RHOBADRAFT_65606 [Rhodotorula graminis WP1]
MSAVKVYGFEGNPRTRAALVVAKYEGVDVEWVKVNPFAEGGVGADYLAKFPLGLVPALEKGDYKLTEALAIASYLAQDNKSGVLGASKEDAADALRWASWANADLLPSLAAWFRPLTGAAPYQKPAVEAAKAKAVKHLEYLEKALASRTFLVGERVTLADIFVASVLFRGFENVLDAEWRKANPNTVRYWQTVIHQQPFFEVLGKVEPTPVETAVVYTPPKKEAKLKADAPAAAAPKKEAKPAAKEEEDDEPAAEAPKAKHPCEALGKPASFPLDEWKRQYSNLETVDALKWLDSQYPAFTQDYSLWKVTYKYNDELTQVFMSSNLVGGLHARLEASRKYLFGSMGVYGKANDSLITGAYLLRGSDAHAVFEVAPDAESYSFEPLDWVKDREFITGAWTWEHTVDGKEYADGKVFK